MRFRTILYNKPEQTFFFSLSSFCGLSGAEIGRFVAMLRNPSSILKACAAFALLQVIFLAETLKNASSKFEFIIIYIFLLNICMGDFLFS